ncbi:MAG: peptidoglycan D,D-transpeptidase FtsI family protein, partial [Pirellulales bacterium]
LPDKPAVARARGAAAVVLDVRSGAVRAAISVPRYDPNALASQDAGAWRRLTTDPAAPLFNRVAAGALPPGSVFKTVSAMALAADGRFDPHEEFFCQGYLHSPDRLRCLIFTKYGVGHGATQLADAIKRSCNVYFFHGARIVGPEAICRWAQAFGFGRPTGIDLPGESPGNLMTPQNVRQTERHPWRPGDTPRLAIGQTTLLATPLQVARLMAAVGNGGTLVTPHVVAGFGPSFVGEPATRPTIASAPTSGRVPGLTRESLQIVRSGLRQVVEEPHGTGHRTVYLKAVAVAGKTGTAEVGRGKPPHAWFAGYVPADEPRYAFAVVVEHGGSGGRAAGPVARALVEKMLRLGYFDGATRSLNVAAQ